MNDRGGPLARSLRGRMLKRGITWWSALLVFAVILGGFVGLGALLRRQATVYELDVTVEDRMLVEFEGGCELVWQVRVGNPNDQRMSLVSFAIDAVDDSDRRILGSIEPFGSVDREYRLQLDDCADAPGEGPVELTTTFKLTGTQRERTVSDLVD